MLAKAAGVSLRSVQRILEAHKSQNSVMVASTTACRDSVFGSRISRGSPEQRGSRYSDGSRCAN
jgi:hypothetical protein